MTKKRYTLRKSQKIEENTEYILDLLAKDDGEKKSLSDWDRSDYYRHQIGVPKNWRATHHVHPDALPDLEDRENSESDIGVFVSDYIPYVFLILVALYIAYLL